MTEPFAKGGSGVTKSAVLVLALLLSGCGSGGSDKAGATPAKMPSDTATDPQLGLPIYPGSRIVRSSTAAEDKRAGAVFVLESGDGAGEVMSFYRDAVRAAGYDIKTDINAGTIRMLGAAKGEERLTVQAAVREAAAGPTGAASAAAGSTITITRGGA